MERIDFNKGWFFACASNEDWSNQPMNQDMTPINLPHDFRISLPRSANSVAGPCEGYFEGGIGYYEKRFTLDAKQAAQRLLLYFDGVYRLSEVRFNKQLLSLHSGGYSAFFVDLTGYALEGENVLNIKANGMMAPASRWYPGAGIYRQVTLYAADSPCFEPWGTEVLTRWATEGRALLTVTAELHNPDKQPCHVRFSILSPDGTEAAVINELIRECCCRDIYIETPKLWSAETPDLYTLRCTLLRKDGFETSAETRFGIRTVTGDAEHGLRINGKPTLLKGGCVHHDNGLLGSRSFPCSERRKISKLKENGYNAVRCAHNPPSTAFLDACDELGMYVIDEAFDCWREGKRLNDEHLFFEAEWENELNAMILRDRNHPSVIMWSTGNEIVERSGISGGAQWSAKLADTVRKLDSSRLVNNALCGFFADTSINELEANVRSTTGEGKDTWAASSEAFCRPLDVVGYNYLLDRYEKDHALFPRRVICGTESFALKALENWRAVLKYPYVIGDFVWTAWDYLGETGIGHTRLDTEARGLVDYPWHVANCGDLDICGRKRPQSHYRDFVWSGRKAPYIAVRHPSLNGRKENISAWGWPDLIESWSFPGYEGVEIDITVYAGGDRVELKLNGEVIDSLSCDNAGEFVYKFKAAYAPGELTAAAYDGDACLGRTSLYTAGRPASIRLVPETGFKCDGGLAFVEAELVDAEGRIVPNDDREISFTADGGYIIAMGSGDPASSQSYSKPKGETWRGRVMVVVQASDNGGGVVLRAQCLELPISEVRID